MDEAHLAQSLPRDYFLERLQGLLRAGSERRDSRIPSSASLSRGRRERDVGRSSIADRPWLLFICDHDGRPPRRGVGCDGSLQMDGVLTRLGFRQTLETLRPVIVPDDDFMAVEAIQQQIANTQAARTKDLENINDKVKGKTRGCKSYRGANCLNGGLQDYCELWKRQRYRAADRHRSLRQADMRK